MMKSGEVATPGSEYLRSVSVLGRGAYGRVAAEMGGGGQTSGTRGRLRLVGLLRLDSGQPTVRGVGAGLGRH